MNFLSVSIKKISFLVGIFILLISATFVTFSLKTSHYGDSSMLQVATWIITNSYNAAKYTVRVESIENQDNLASAYSSLPRATSTQNTSGEASAIPVLVYHTVQNGSEAFNLESEIFEEQLFALKEAGWNTITLKEFQDFMRNKTALPKRSFLLTFDDGAKNSYHPVTPLLKALNFTAVSFLLPKYSIGTGSHYYISTSEIQNMLESGYWEIGSHGLAVHEYELVDSTGTFAAPLVNYLWIESKGREETRAEYLLRITNDLTSAKEMLEKTFDLPITAFAFPFGEYGRPTLSNPNATDGAAKVAAEVYETSFYQWWAGEGFSYNYPNLRTHGLFKRIEPSTAWSGDFLVQQFESGLPKKLPYQSLFLSDEGWLLNWGTVLLSNDSTMRLVTDPQGTGAAVYLDGSGHWDNYKIDVTLRSPTNTGFSLVARYADSSNFALCNFGHNFVHIEESVAGKGNIIEGVRGGPYLPEGTYTAQLSIQGRNMSCSINDVTIVSTEYLDPLLASGGVGIKTWSTVRGEASLIVEKFTVTPL